MKDEKERGEPPKCKFCGKLSRYNYIPEKGFICARCKWKNDQEKIVIHYHLK